MSALLSEKLETHLSHGKSGLAEFSQKPFKITIGEQAGIIDTLAAKLPSVRNWKPAKLEGKIIPSGR